MRKIKFTKMVASGNDFIIVNQISGSPASLRNLAEKICDRKFGIGADGLLLLEESKIADIKMRIFNPDGSEAEMCGNGLRCVALYKAKNQIKIETKAGITEAGVRKDNVKIKLIDPKDIKLDIPIRINNRNLKVNFVDTGVPHTVIFVLDLEKIDVFGLGRLIRYYKRFRPKGTNVDFVEVVGKNTIAVRTYERGVENETLACGTGVVASALIFALKADIADKVFVHTRSGEILTVYFIRVGDKFNDVWFEGKTRIVYEGVYYV